MNPENVWQICLDEVLAGHKTPAECAALYPQLEGLEAELQRAVALRTLQTLTMHPAASQRLDDRLRQRARALKAAGAPARRPALLPWRQRWVLGPALAGVLLVTGIGTSAAAAASNPGDLLYQVKRVDENVQVFLSPPAARADTYTSLARHRLDELAVVLQRSEVDPNILNRLTDDLTAQTADALAAVDQAPIERQAEVLNALVQLTNEQQTALVRAEQAAPAAAQAGLQRALQASTAGHARASARLEQGTGRHHPTSTPTASATATAADTTTATPTATGTDLLSETHEPPGQTKVPPGQTKIPPGQDKTPQPTQNKE